MRLRSDAPKVTLTKVFSTPFDNAVATARTCYSSRIITDDDVALKPELRDRIASSIYLAGHHTTLQHAHFQFAIENVSRQALWSFFHAHPFYNSEQVSQRYVEVRAGKVLLPELSDDALNARFLRCVERQMATYQELLGLLEAPVSEAYYSVFQARRGRTDKRYQGQVKKRCQEVSRYVLPIGTFAHLYHTVSGLTLHRYHRLAESFDCPAEQRMIVDAMVSAVQAIDPLFFKDAEATLDLSATHEAPFLQTGDPSSRRPDTEAFLAEFDAGLGEQAAVLVGATASPEQVLGAAVREVFGLPAARLSDEDAIAYLLDPKQNRYLGDSLTLTTLGKATRALELVHFTFRKKLSHSADSQAQRHRMTPGARPALSAHIVPGRPDYVTPMVFDHPLAGPARAVYEREMSQTWEDIDALARAGVSPEAWQYLLPNAVSVRFTESGSLLDQHHKWTTRLCFTAQEEIWRATRDEVDAVCQHAPAIGRWLLPPCGLRDRAGIRPTCPEGERFCGVVVWRQPRERWLRVL
jgi:thymidylate synthase ThyX